MLPPVKSSSAPVPPAASETSRQLRPSRSFLQLCQGEKPSRRSLTDISAKNSELPYATAEEISYAIRKTNPDPSSWPKNVGIGQELEGSEVQRSFKNRGVGIAKGPFMIWEKDGRTLENIYGEFNGTTIANLEAISRPFFEPLTYDLSNRCLTQIYTNLIMYSRQNPGKNVDLRCVLPEEFVFEDSVFHDSSLISSTIMSSKQITIGVVPSTNIYELLGTMRYNNKIIGLSDILEYFSERKNQSVSLELKSFLKQICAVIHDARAVYNEQQQSSLPTPHAYFSVCPRSSHSQEYLKLSSEDKNHFMWLASEDPNFPGEIRILRAMKIYRSARLFPGRTRMNRPPPKDGICLNFPTTPPTVLLHGPLVSDFIRSIYDPEHFGRNYDLLSPFGQSEDQVEKSHSIGTLPEVEGKLVELRDPTAFGLNAHVIATSIQQYAILAYKKLQRFNQNLYQIDFKKCDVHPEEDNENLKVFNHINKIVCTLHHVRESISISKAFNYRDGKQFEVLKDENFSHYKITGLLSTKVKEVGSADAILKEIRAEMTCLAEPGQFMDNEDLQERLSRLTSNIDYITRIYNDAMFEIGQVLFPVTNQCWEDGIEAFINDGMMQ